MKKDYLSINCGTDGKDKNQEWYMAILEKREGHFTFFKMESDEIAEFSSGLVNILTDYTNPPVKFKFEGKILPQNEKIIRKIVKSYNHKSS